MNSTIKFRHNYEKLPHILTNILLLDVLKVNLKDLSQTFLDYDTSYLENEIKQNYKLPKSGEYLLLLFYQKETNQVFTTLRRYEPQKYDYYKSKIGQKFDIEMHTQSPTTSTQRKSLHEEKQLEKFYEYIKNNFTARTYQILRSAEIEFVNGQAVFHTQDKFIQDIVEQYFGSLRTYAKNL